MGFITITQPPYLVDTLSDIDLTWPDGCEIHVLSRRRKYILKDGRLIPFSPPLIEHRLSMINIAQLAPFTGAAVSTGTLTSRPGQANRPGIARITSSNTANSGYLLRTDSTSVLLSGGETFEAVIYPLSLTSVTMRMGFLYTTSVTAPTNGAYIEILPGGILTGKTRTASVQSVTSNSYTLSINTWYKLVVDLENSTKVGFHVYNAVGDLLWENSISTNIPTATGREVACEFIATNSVNAATALVEIDSLTFSFSKSIFY